MTEQTPDPLVDLIAVLRAASERRSTITTHQARQAADALAAVVRASGAGLGGTSREQAWDEGYRTACRDHSTWCRRTDGDHGQRHINPYRDDVRPDSAPAGEDHYEQVAAERDAARAEVTFWQSAMQAHADCDARDAALDAARAEVAALRAAQPGRGQVWDAIRRAMHDADESWKGWVNGTPVSLNVLADAATDAVLALRQEQP